MSMESLTGIATEVKGDEVLNWVVRPVERSMFCNQQISSHAELTEDIMKIHYKQFFSGVDVKHKTVSRGKKVLKTTNHKTQYLISPHSYLLEINS